MRMKYRFVQLSKNEQELLEMILMDEIDLQAWYTVTYSGIFGEEILLAIQQRLEDGLKAITVTAFMALVVAIPFFMARRTQVSPIRHYEAGSHHDEELRYDIDDFLT